MSTMLINGCSYAHAWGPAAADFGSALGFDQTVNLGMPGGSNDRTFRTTQNYILQHKVDFVVLMLTFWSRTESPWLENDPIEGPWISYCDPESFTESPPTKSRTFVIPPQNAKDFARARMLNECYPADCDRLLTDLIFATGWLESINMPYLIFGACDKEYTDPAVHQSKVDKIKANTRIIDIYNWSSNEYLASTGAVGQRNDALMVPMMKHYHWHEHAPLSEFLVQYINSNNLLQPTK